MRPAGAGLRVGSRARLPVRTIEGDSVTTPTGRGPEGQQGQQGQQGQGQTYQGQGPEQAAAAPGQQAATGQTPPQGPGSTTTTTTAAPKAGTTSTRDVVRIVLHVLALVLVVLAISVDMDDRGGNLWGDTWTWAGFATLMALAQVAALLPRTALSGTGWTVGAVGAGGLVLFWTLLMLPQISTNMAFLVTLGTACAVAGVLLSPDRKV